MPIFMKPCLSVTLRKLLLILLMTITFIFSFSGKTIAQGDDDNNHYKGLFANRFDSTAKWSLHFQLTSIVQAHPGFNAPYSGRNSLRDTAEKALSLTSTLYLDRKLWKGAAVFVNPEIAGGKGISEVLGLGGASNGETFRVGNPEPTLYMARLFFEQHIAIGKSRAVNQSDEENKISESIPSSRITISLGKFSLADFFDDNSYSHDSRTEFMNWSLMDNGAWDYAANTRGYTWGGVVEFIKPGYAFRLASVLVPQKANAPILDGNVTKANSEVAEFEKKIKIKNQPGSIRFLAFTNFSSAPSYSTATTALHKGDTALVSVFTGQRAGDTYGGFKYGFGISFNQSISKRYGIFSRVGWNDGQTATWAFTEIDRTVSAGLRVRPSVIKRPDDNFGIAVVVNGISGAHRDYLNAGGYGFMLGDGKLPDYGLEKIVETFYKVKLTPWLWATADYQFVLNPGYNKDRGPVHIFAVRGHVEF